MTALARRYSTALRHPIRTFGTTASMLAIWAYFYPVAENKRELTEACIEVWLWSIGVGPPPRVHNGIELTENTSARQEAELGSAP